MSRFFEIFDKQEVYRLDEPSMPLLIGTSDKAHIRLDDGHDIVAYVAESRKHLFLQPADNGQTIAFYHNDESVSGSVWLKSEDVTRLGDTELRWFFSGQRVEIHVSKAGEKLLRPPIEPPPGHQESAAKDAIEVPLAPVAEAPVRSYGKKARAAVFALFLLLLAAAAFVLLAKPLVVTVTPAPDNISISGFPPVITFGGNYLGFPGRYSLHAEKAGYTPLAEQVEITGRGSNYNFKLEKLPGRVDLTSTPSGVTVLVDGTRVGETPLQELEIPAGSRRIRFEHDRYLPTEKTMEIKGFGERQALQVELEPAWAKVTLRTEPQGAELTIDGETRGTTPLQLELLAGEHQLVFSRAKFSPLEVTLAIEAGQDSSPSVYQLKPAPAELVISTQPSGATVAINGTFKGVTPLSLSLPPGKDQELRLTLAGHRPAQRKLQLEAGEERELDVELKPEYGTVFIVASPAGASLAIDGKQQQQTTGRFQLTTRAHTLELSADGFQTVRRTVTPKTGYSQRIEISLKREQTAGQTKQATASGPLPQAELKQKLASRLTTSLNQTLVLITPEPFLMGASRKEAGRRANESEHQVVMQRSFYLAEREVSNAEYKQFQAQHSSGMMGNRSLEVDSHPVANVSWDEAVHFLNWLSRKDGLPPFYREENGVMVAIAPAGTGYRLPTEAEWAFAARQAARKERVRYPWPGNYPPQVKAGNFADESSRHLLPVVIEGYNDGFPASAPTGSFPANPAGIFDLGGNVAEWCHDHYVANPADKNAVDPMGPATGSHHVVRGSSWRDASITELRFSYRRYSREAANDIGFRIARYAQ